MCVIATTGGLLLVLSEAHMSRMILTMVARASGTPIGSAFFHLIPQFKDVEADRPVQPDTL